MASATNSTTTSSSSSPRSTTALDPNAPSYLPSSQLVISPYLPPPQPYNLVYINISQPHTCYFPPALLPDPCYYIAPNGLAYFCRSNQYFPPAENFPNLPPPLLPQPEVRVGGEDGRRENENADADADANMRSRRVEEAALEGMRRRRSLGKGRRHWRGLIKDGRDDNLAGAGSKYRRQRDPPPSPPPPEDDFKFEENGEEGDRGGRKTTVMIKNVPNKIT